MDVSTFINTARTQSHTPITLVDDDEGLLLLNLEYQDWVSFIKDKIGEEYFFKEYVNDVVAGSVDYPLDLPTSVAEGIDKIIKVGIKYTLDQEFYTMCTPMSVKTLTNTLDYYKTGQPTTTPFYTISENMIRIYPASEVDIDEGAYLASTYTPIDLLIGDDESKILIPRQYQTGLLYGLMSRMFQKRGLTNDEQYYKSRADVERSNMVKSMGNRVQ